MTLTTDPLLDVVTLLLVGGTVALAIYTAKLHGATVQLAKDTVEANTLADLHHQESLTPVCVIRDVRCAMVPQQPGQATDFFTLTFVVENQGNGPALQLRVAVTPVNAVRDPTGKPELSEPGPLKPGEISPPQFGPYQRSTQEADGFVVKVTYETIFDTAGEWHITYTSASTRSTTKIISFVTPKPKDRLRVT